MKQTLAARLLAQFEKLNTLYVNGNGQSVAPQWLTTIFNFLEHHRHDHNLDMKRMSELWHHQHDSATYGNWADQMIKANDEYMNMTSTVDA